MKNESVKKSLEKSKNVLEEKRKTVERKKTNAFNIIATNFVREQLNTLKRLVFSTTNAAVELRQNIFQG